MAERPGREQVEAFVRSYQTLLRSTGEVRVAGLLAPYLEMAPTLHVKAASPSEVDAAALTYVGLRLRPCMPRARQVLLFANPDALAERGYTIDEWQTVEARARRRRQFFDGGDTLAMLIASPSDVDDILPSLIAYELEWNKVYDLLLCDKALAALVERAAAGDVQAGDTARLAQALSLTQDEVDRLDLVFDGGLWKTLRMICQQRKRLAVRMVGGSWNDLERASERWYESVAQHVGPDLSRRPIYFVSSNMHSLVNLLSGSVLARQAEIIDYIQRSDSQLLRAEYADITSDRVRSSLENFLYYAAKKYLSDAASGQAAQVFGAEERASGMTTI